MNTTLIFTNRILRSNLKHQNARTMKRQFASSSNSSAVIRNMAMFGVAGITAFGITQILSNSINEPEIEEGEAVPPQAEITHRVYFDVDINSIPAGRVVMGLYGNVVPKTVKNFYMLCEGNLKDPNSGLQLSYSGSSFHRIIPNFVSMCSS